MNCIFCGGPNLQERVEAGFTHCMNNSCLAQHHAAFRARTAIVLLHKQGFTFERKDRVVDLQNGRLIKEKV